jgi:uncharacterized protein
MTGLWRLVLDTNAVLSSLLFASGRLAPLRVAWQEARFRPIVSAATTKELARALAYPELRFSATEQQELLADYLPYCETARMSAKPPETPVGRDPFDIPFLQLAILSKADDLVSGDKDLLSLAGCSPRPIITADWLLDMLSRD